MRKLLPIAAVICAMAAQVAPAQQPKQIKDAAEYDAYTVALKEADPAKKAAAMEAFVKSYPNSIVNIEALEAAMRAYQELGSQNDVESTARRILALDTNNVRALAIVVLIERADATRASASQTALAQLRAESERGLAALPRWDKPDDMTDADFAKLRNQVTEIFAGAAGLVALQAKDFASAQKLYAQAVAAGPDDLQNVYQLSISELGSSPPNPAGFWHAARAMHLASAANKTAAVQSIEQYAKAKYVRFHGADDGWDTIVKQAAAAAAEPPKDFTVKAAATPAEIAVQALKTYDPSALSFSDMEFVLSMRDASPANKDAAERVWQAIQTHQANGARFKIHVKVIRATASELEVAVSDENRQDNKSDMHVLMAKPLANPPAPGSYVDVVGRIVEYTASPFKFTLTQGEI